MNDDLITVATTLALYTGLVVSPGPGFALVSRLALSGARGEAFATTLGFGLGATFYAVLSLTGLALAIRRVAWIADLIQIAGGLYLIGFGLQCWLNASHGDLGPARTRRSDSVWRGFRTGLLVDLSNPKGIAFFLSLYAVAVPLDTAFWAKTAIVAGGFILEVGWYNVVALVLSAPPAQRFYRRFAAIAERAIGSALMAFGARMLIDKTV